MKFIEDIDEKQAPSRCIINSEKKVFFDPPVYELRYLKTSQILSHEKFRNQIKRIVEFGCAEMKFLVYMKNGMKKCEVIDLVDIDGDLLNRFKQRIDPLIYEYVKKRETKLTCRVWQGSVSVENPNFKDVDAVVAIELIEHVFPDVLDDIPFNIFGRIKPKIAIITTPNAEFNVLFDLKPGTFRHFDHKFEWTRSEFEDWCDNICLRYPEYCVQFHGVGEPPEGFENLGSCSQMGFFIRKDFLESLDLLKDEEESEEKADEVLIETDDYKLVHSVEYPFFCDKRNRHDKISDEVDYQVNRLRWMEEDFFNYKANRIEIPLNIVSNLCWQVTEDADEVRTVVESKYSIENNFIILPPNESSEDSEVETEM